MTIHFSASLNFSALLGRCIAQENFSYDEMTGLFEGVMQGTLESAQIGALLTALGIKGESATEIHACATVMQNLSTQVKIADSAYLVDIVGTGGDNHHTFNVSTTSMLVAGAAGARVAKHGARSVSSLAGSADTLERLGVNINLNPQQVAASIEDIGVGFMFAPNYHLAMKNVVPIRRQLGVRTLFNILGPLANPARVPNIVLGVFNRQLQRTMAEVLRLMGMRRALVVHSDDGLDEFALSGPSFVIELEHGELRDYTVHPSQFGLSTQAISAIKVADGDAACAMLLSVLNGELGAARDIVLLNSGAALYVSGVTDSIDAGVALAAKTIDSGEARLMLDRMIQFGAQYA